MSRVNETFRSIVGTGGVLVAAQPGHVLRVTEEPEQTSKPEPPDPRGRPGKAPTA